MSSKRSRVHPKFKTKYHVCNWREYDRGLVDRGDLTVWISQQAADSWRPKPTRERGGQRRFSDTAIETALTLRLLFHLRLRQTEGFLRSLFALMRVALDAPDHTTLSRRARSLEVRLHRPASTGPIHLVIDSSSLSIFGEGEWAAAKHGARGKRGCDRIREPGVVPDRSVEDAGSRGKPGELRSVHQRRGTLSITLTGVALQTYEPGTVLVPLAVSIGATQLQDKPLLVVTKRSFRY